MKKHIHRIIINKQKKYKYSYTYNFGHTKDVLIELSANSIRITAMLKKLYDKFDENYVANLKKKAGEIM